MISTNDTVGTLPRETGSAQVEALACAALGLPVFPLHGVTDGKCDCKHEHPEKDVGNHPCLGESCVSATTSTTKVNNWFVQRPNCNYAIASGKEILDTGMKLVIMTTGRENSEMTTVLTALDDAGVQHVLLGHVMAGDGSRFIYLSVPLEASLDDIKFKGYATKYVDYAPGPGSVYSNGQKTIWLSRSPQALSPECVSTLREVPVDHEHEAEAEADGAEQTANLSIGHIEAALSSPEQLHVTSHPLFSAASDAVLRVQKTRAAALSYAKQGFKLCRIAKGTKAPKDTAWPDNPIDPRKAGDHGLGIIHKLSGTCAIDFDDLVNAQAWFANHGVDIGEYLDADDAVQIKSGRGNRAKLLFRVPPEIKLLQTHKIKNPDGSMMIEFRCSGEGDKGVQDVLPPSIHPDTGQAYEWAGAGEYTRLPVLPAALLTVWRHLDGPADSSPASVECNKVKAPSTTVIVEGGRNETLFKIGGDLAALKLSPDAIEAALLKENEKRCVPPLGRDEVAKVAASASKTSRGAKQAVSSELSENERRELLKDATMALNASAGIATPQAHSYAKLPPVMQSIAEWCQTNGRTVQPAFALCTALAACSGVLSRDFTGAAGAHTNLYCVAVGPTGCGKENVIETVVQVVTAYEQGRLAGVPASDTGVLTAMKRHPASVFIIDEIGEVLKSVFDSRAASHMARIGTAFMELYTKGGKPYRGKEYANQSVENGKPRVDIFSPCPSVFGATTATTLYGAMNSDVVSSGFLPRMLVFRAPDTIPMPNLDYADTPLPDVVHNWIEAIQARVAQHGATVSKVADLAGTATDDYAPIRVPYSTEATLLLREAQVDIVNRRNATMDALEGNMMSRVVENAGRVALTLALAEDPWATEVSAACFNHAMEIVQQSTATFIADIRANLFDSVHAKVETAVLKKINEHFVATKGKPISDGVLVDRCRPYGAARPQERKAVIDALVRQGKVTTSPGRKTGTVLYTPSFGE
jgi:hypothetical protein